MHKIRRYLTLITLFISIATIQSWTILPFDKIPVANPEDQIEVRYLQAPLLYDKFHEALALLHLYHVGLGFKHLSRPEESWQVEFDGLNGDRQPDFIRAVLPIITKNATTGNPELEWSTSGGAILYGAPINETYWEKQWVITTINGTQHNRFVKEFLSQVNSTRPYYDLFDVFQEFPQGPHFIQAYTCMDFAWEAMAYMYNKLNVEFDYSQKLKRVYTIFYAKYEPQLVHYDDPIYHDQIVAFYEVIEGKLKKMNLIKFILELGHILNGHVFLRTANNNHYYSIKLHEPFFGWHYSFTPMPGQNVSTLERKYLKLEESVTQKEIERNSVMLRQLFNSQNAE